MLWVQAVEVFEWDCGCLTSAGFYRYRCRRCCWFFCSQGHFTKRSKSHKKKSWRKERMDWVCVRYTCIPESRENLIRISWESHENLVRSSRDHCTLMRISWENFSLVRISWESHENSVQASISIFRVFMRKRPKMLMRISRHSHEKDSHEKALQFSREKRLTRISWETHEKSHEKLMKARKSHEKTFQFSRENENLVRFSRDLVKSSWDSHENRWQFSNSHENLMRFSWVLMRIFVRGWWSNALSDCLVVYVRVHEGQRHDNPAVTESRNEYYQHPCRMSFWRGDEGTLSWVNCILVGQRRMVCDFLMDSSLSGLVLLDAGDTLRCVRQCGWLFFSFLFFFFFLNPFTHSVPRGTPKLSLFKVCKRHVAPV